MLDIVVLVSGGGTNLQTLIDRIADGTITNGRIVKVISSRRDAYALERAKKHGIPSAVVPRGEYEDAAGYEAALHADRKSTRLNSSHDDVSRMPSSA